MPRMFFKKITKKLTVNKDEQMKSLQNDILEGFLYSLKKRDIHQKEAFLLSGFSDDIKRLSIKNGLEDALITNTCTLKRKIAVGFPEELMGMLDRGPLPDIYSAIYYSVKGCLKLNHYGYTETLPSDFGTKIWTMACGWGNLLILCKNEKQNTASIAT